MQRQLRLYRRRLQMMNWASWLAAVALLCFLGAVMAGGLSRVYPHAVALKLVGTAGILLGLVLMAVAALLELVESVLGRHEVGTESGDLDDSAKSST